MAVLNNMKFNNSKFIVLMFGENTDLKENTLYFTDMMEEVITSAESHRDLGIQMSASGNFREHISNVISAARRRIGWICRTFYNRSLQFM